MSIKQSSSTPKVLASSDDQSAQQDKKRFNLFSAIGQAFKRTCTVIGFLVLLSASISLGMTIFLFGSMDVKLPEDNIVLLFELDQPVIEHDQQLSPYNFAEQPYKIRMLTRALHHAAQDDRVDGMVLSYKGGSIGLTHIQELRTAVKEFRESGKFTYIYAPSYEGSGNGLGLYYLASAFEQIWMQPLGNVSIPGIQAELPYARKVIDKLGVQPQFYQREEYKGLFEAIEEEGITPATRAAITAMVNDIGDQILSDISADRGMEEVAMRALIDQALFVDYEAEDAGLIDHLGFPDDVTADIKMKVQQQADVAVPVTDQDSSASDDETSVTQDQPQEDTSPSVGFVQIDSYYQAVAHEKFEDKKVVNPQIALIYAVGPIQQTASNGSDGVVAADELSTLIINSVDDPSIKVLVVRVVSPGGSPTASETIRHALVYAQSKGKPVIVSMGEMAASGGYWMSTHADRIFALPSTLTGSIGVAGGKFSLEEMWTKIGVNWDTVSWGKNAGLWSLNQPFSEHGDERMNTVMDHIYKQFVSRVAEGRKMSFEQARNVAKGRVWTGNQAAENGLVDEIGDLNDALDYAAKIIGAPYHDNVPMIILPEPKGIFEQIMEMMGAQVTAGQRLDDYTQALEVFKPAVSQLQSIQNRERIDLARPEFTIR